MATNPFRLRRDSSHGCPNNGEGASSEESVLFDKNERIREKDLSAAEKL